MNGTITQSVSNQFSYETTTYVALGLFVLSEVMPFIKKTKALEVAEAVVEEKEEDKV